MAGDPQGARATGDRFNALSFQSVHVCARRTGMFAKLQGLLYENETFHALALDCEQRGLYPHLFMSKAIHRSIFNSRRAICKRSFGMA